MTVQFEVDSVPSVKFSGDRVGGCHPRVFDSPQRHPPRYHYPH